MKRFLLFLLTFALGFFVSAQKLVKLSGSIGKYPIEMELQQEKGEEAEYGLSGKYRYQGKTEFLHLDGNVFGEEVLWLEESWNGEVSGNFYLEFNGEGEFSGRWLGNGTFHNVNLSIAEGGMTDLKTYDLEEMKAKTTRGITGSYAVEDHFINEMWFSEENPVLEIGFNGGVVTAKETDKTHVEIEFQFVCGPTYHMAFFSGEATKIGKRTYEFNAPWDEGEEDNCHLVFIFKDKQLEIVQHTGGYHCGFGARAYAGGTYDKVSDKVVVNEEEGPSMRDVLNQ